MRRVPLPLLPAWLRWAAAIVVAAVIFYLSIITTPPPEPIAPKPELLPLDKWRHFVAYAAFGWSLGYATVDWRTRSLYLGAFVVGITIVYGVGIEFLQAPLPQRYFSLGDAYANALGGVLVIPFFVLRSYLDLVPIPGRGSVTQQR